MANYVSKHTGAQIDSAIDKVPVIEGKVATLTEEIARKDKPLVYIDGKIPTTKDNVLAEMRVVSSWLNFHAYIKIKCQGTSSLAYPKKNFSVTLYQDEARTVPLYITIPGWKVASNKFVLKANWIDHIHARNIINARLWSEVVASRSDYDTLPSQLRNSPNNGAVDGFPIIVTANGTYQGIYTWNIGKEAWLFGMDEDNPNHALLCNEDNSLYYPTTSKRTISFDLSVETGGYQSKFPLILFSERKGAEYFAFEPCGTYRLYSFKVTRKSTGDVLLDMLPAVDAEGRPGMFDSVTQRMFYNDGTGAFAVPAVTEAEET